MQLPRHTFLLSLDLLHVIEREGFASPGTGPPAPLPLVQGLIEAGDILLLVAVVLGHSTSWQWHHQQHKQKQESLPEPYHAQLLWKLGCSSVGCGDDTEPLGQRHVAVVARATSLLLEAAYVFYCNTVPYCSVYLLFHDDAVIVNVMWFRCCCLSFPHVHCVVVGHQAALHTPT